MYHTETKIRVRYAETDRMGYCYYGNYATFFEVARVEMLRSLGVTYKELEDQGILLPVLEYSIKFFKPALYDDELIIKTTMPELPQARVKFDYETYNQNNDLLNKAHTTLVFVNKETGKPTPASEDFLDKLEIYFT